MIGHRRRGGPFRPCIRRSRPYTAAPNDAESVRPIWVARSGGTNWVPVSGALGRIRATCPVARIGRASPSAHPVGRQPTVDPHQRAFARPRCRRPARQSADPGAAPGRRPCSAATGAAVRPPAPRRTLLPAAAGSARAPRADPLVARLLLLPAPAGARAATPHGTAAPESPPAAAPPALTPQRGGGGGRAALRRRAERSRRAPRRRPALLAPAASPLRTQPSAPPGHPARRATDTLRVMRLLDPRRHGVPRASRGGGGARPRPRGDACSTAAATAPTCSRRPSTSSATAAQRPARARGRRLGRGRRHSGYQPADVAASSRAARRGGRRAPRVRLDLQRLPGWPARARERGDAGLDRGRRLRPEQGRVASARPRRRSRAASPSSAPACSAARTTTSSACRGGCGASAAAARSSPPATPTAHRPAHRRPRPRRAGSSTSASDAQPGAFNATAPPAARRCARSSTRRSRATGSDARLDLGARRGARRRGGRRVGRGAAVAAGGRGPGTWRVAASRAEAAGLRCRPMAETVADVWAWLGPAAREAEGAGLAVAARGDRHVARARARAARGHGGAASDRRRYSHSIVPGGLLVMSSTTRLTSRSSLIIREAICSSRSYGQPRPVGRHRVVARDRADHDDVAVRALVALHADRADVRQHAEGLPQLAVEAGVADLVLEDVVGVAQEVEARLARLAADDADRQAGAGERLAPDEALGHPELGAHRADLVLEQRAQRLDELELEVLGEAADVVVGLDRRRAGAAAGLDDVGVQRALHEVARALAALRELAPPPPRRRG